MADPLGIAGTAAGLVSLGLQLYGEIFKYIKAVNGREDDLKAARQNAEILKKCLLAIKGTTALTSIAHMATKDAVDECVASCKDELKQLEALLTRLRGPEAPAETLSARTRERGRRLMYPFRKDSIAELETRLASTNAVLQTALNALGLNVSISTHGVASDIQSHITAMKISNEQSNNQISAMSTMVEDIRTITCKSHHLIPEIHAKASETSLLMNNRMKRCEELLEQLVASSTGPPKALQQFGQLTSCPSDLSTLCDGFLDPNPPRASRVSLFATGNSSGIRKTSVGFRPCPCTRRQYVQRHRRALGPLTFETETSEMEYHAPDCPLSQLRPPEQQVRKGLSVTVPGMQKLLRRAIRFSLSLSHGAGGSALSQSLSWVATVDATRAPAFRICDIAISAIYLSTLTNEKRRAVLNSCWRRLFWCFAQKTASPTDVDENGITILGRVVTRVEPLDKADIAPFILSLMALKMTANSPASAWANESIFAWIMGSKWLRQRNAVPTLLDALSHSYDPGEYNLRGVATLPDILDMFLLFRSFPELAKVLQFGPLMLGIIQKDLGTVRHLLKLQPQSILEVNHAKQTPIHIAVLTGNVSILELVLSCSNEQLLSTSDSYGYYPIEYATIEQLHKACLTRGEAACQGCRIVGALLRARSVLFPRAIRLAFGQSIEADNHPLSFGARAMLLRHLREQRIELKAFAKQHLPRKQRQLLNSPTNGVLDRNALQVQKLLEGQSIYIPSYLKICDETTKSIPSNAPRTVYNYIYDRRTANLAWELGFRDIDPMDGLSQMVDGALKFQGFNDQVIQGFIGYVSWLLDRGLDLKSPIPTALLDEDLRKRWHLRATGAHYCMKLLGRYNTFPLSKSLAKAVFSRVASDHCSCPCSPSGCTPLMKFFEELQHTSWRFYGNALHNLQQMCRLALKMIPHNERKSQSYSWIYHAILRRITFDALSLRHTCCSLERWHQELDEEDIAEIQMVNAERLLLFETLCEEFTAKCGSNLRLLQVVRDTWEPRMKYEIEMLERKGTTIELTAEERLAAEEIGVIWNTDSSDISISESDHVWETPQGLLQMLDGIVPDPNIQLPHVFELR